MSVSVSLLSFVSVPLLSFVSITISLYASLRINVCAYVCICMYVCVHVCVFVCNFVSKHYTLFMFVNIFLFNLPASSSTSPSLPLSAPLIEWKQSPNPLPRLPLSFIPFHLSVHSIFHLIHYFLLLFNSYFFICIILSILFYFLVESKGTSLTHISRVMTEGYMGYPNIGLINKTINILLIIPRHFKTLLTSTTKYTHKILQKSQEYIRSLPFEIRELGLFICFLVAYILAMSWVIHVPLLVGRFVLQLTRYVFSCIVLCRLLLSWFDFSSCLE